MSRLKSKIIAFYLPQFHPIPENDVWWGKGFTEWTNVGKAKPFYRGHLQPKVPKDLGYYDLRLPEVRSLQASMAKEAGIDGFCYWHYWFGGGRRLLERPFHEVIESGEPDFPFCLGWANHSWKAKNWNSFYDGQDRVLIEQTYPGDKDYVDHFFVVLEAFRDKRYICIDDKPVFLIFESDKIPDFKHFSDLWNSLARQNGLEGIYFVSYCNNQSEAKERVDMGFDCVTIDLMFESYWNSPDYKLQKWWYRIYNMLYHRNPKPRIIDFEKYMEYSLKAFSRIPSDIVPCILPNYDHSPRSGTQGYVIENCSPDHFGSFLDSALKICNDNDSPLLFIKSWNEWGEGNYLEPDLQYGDEYLRVVKSMIEKYKNI